jgi:putative transposase
MSTPEVCRRHGISQPTFYSWKSKFGGLEVSEAKRLKALEETASSRSFLPNR